MKRVILGTRGSDLARAQTSLVESALRKAAPELEIAVEIIRTSGDEKSSQGKEHGPAGRKGLFTAEIEGALLRRQIDIAVHSAKDLPSDATAGLEICAALPRAAIEDVFVSRDAFGITDLPRGSVVATGSVRRQRQLRWWNSEVEVIELRGNVPTRLRKLIASAWAGIILARAGLERLGFDCAQGTIVCEGQTLRTSILPTDKFLPAGGQGVVALQMRSDDTELRSVLTPLDDPKTRWCLRAEREFLRLLQGDCGTPVGVLGTIRDSWMELRAQVFDGNQREPQTGQMRAQITEQQPEALAASLFEKMYGEQK